MGGWGIHGLERLVSAALLRSGQSGDTEGGTPCHIPMSLNMPPPPPAPMVAGLRDIWVGRLGTPEAGAPVLAPAVREGNATTVTR